MQNTIVNPLCLFQSRSFTDILGCSDPNLHFVEQVALAPPEVQIDQQQQAEYEKQLHDAAAMPLPDADDDDIAE